MKNKIYKYDFLIVGGGLIGSLLAIALHKKNYQVLVIEKQSTISKDNRTLAVNANSRDFLIQLNLWDFLKKYEEPIEKIIIKDFVNLGDLIFNSDEESMGSVIFNSHLLAHARKYLVKNKMLLLGIDYKKLKLKSNFSVLLKNHKYQFKKIILCLGKNHENQELIKKTVFKSSHKSYVGFFNHTKNHNQIAYEIFTPKGPLAVLPSPSSKKNFSTFIYSSAIPISKKQLSNLIIDQFTKSHGSISFISNISSFPITPHLSQPKYPNYILLGDSLRSIHPVAGQGWNLGVKDIQNFCSLLEESSIDSKLLDKIFLSKRMPENISYLAFTNILNTLYDNQSIFSKSLIKGAFSILQNSSLLKKVFIRQAMGRTNLI